MENKIGQILCEKNLTISIAESLIEGIVSYSIESKISRLKVKKETIEKYTDVSYNTAIEMAKGIAETSGSDIGISTTGIAGPGGEPLGLVFIGFYIKGKLDYLKLNLDGQRQEIRNKVVDIALEELYKKINALLLCLYFYNFSGSPYSTPNVSTVTDFIF